MKQTNKPLLTDCPACGREIEIPPDAMFRCPHCDTCILQEESSPSPAEVERFKSEWARYNREHGIKSWWVDVDTLRRRH